MTRCRAAVGQRRRELAPRLVASGYSGRSCGDGPADSGWFSVLASR
eukprot:CAMPEP_0179961358 /NCGR_PEP_ID=MMETSP0983-20121128/29644_1 /TAXON_ID=483367 /ORGANISM="non described non described, Strain CCMP 2436" /LENGTH=45 /DNA_ID= /DNA_START= /DNA_END= /DNA_ORIENTATION=